jgi:hypothetical protein
VKLRHYICTVVGVVALVAAAAWAKHGYSSPTTTLSLRIGETYDEIVKESTYAVVKNSDPPDEKPYYDGSTWISRPAVVIVFNDPEHGFTLPPTKFAGIGYDDRRVITITTSPMLDPLPFDEAITLLNRLQADFKKAGWAPIERSGERPPEWFDTQTTAGLAELRRGNSIELIVPHKYSMYLNFVCWDECYPGPNAKSVYLIDVGIGRGHDTWTASGRASAPRAIPAGGGLQ